MLHRLFHDAKTLVLFCSVLSGFAIAQKPVYPTRTQTPPLPAALQRFQTPAQQVLAPFLKAHPMQASNNGQLHAQDVTNYVTSPNFGGYVNAPLYDARTTASLDTGSFNNGVTVELTADFNKDGKPDIAILQQDGTMNILLGNGSGGLSAPVSYYNPNYLTSSVNNAYAVDVNNDGFADIIGFDYNNDTMITWLNLGNGTFNAAITTPLDASNGYPNYVLVQDANNDGLPDLIFATSKFISRTSNNVYLEVMLGNGDGTFITPAPSKVGTLSVAATVTLPFDGGIVLGDLNGDKKLDIAVAIDERLSASTGQYVVTTALGNGDGTFSQLGTTIPVSVPIGSANGFLVEYNSTGVQLVDLNNDGKLDVATDINGSLMAALGQGNGSFNPAVSSTFSQIVGVTQMLFADLNGDGKPDLIAGGGTLGIYLGNGDGTFAAPLTTAQYVVDPTTDQGLVLADFNGDGIPDVAQLGSDYKQVAMFFGNGKGQLGGAPIITTASDPEGVDWEMETTGKYTASGYSDAVFLHSLSTGVEMLTGVNDGKGNFTFVQSLAGGVPSDLQYIQPIHADLNGDGNEDLVFTGAAGDVTVALSKGDGTFAAPVSVNLPSTLACPVYYAAAGDLNGDGKTDLVIPYGGDVACGSGAGSPSGYYVLLGNGDGTFATPVFTQAGTELYSTTLADINGDGKLDLVLNDAPFVNGSGFSILLATGNGDGAFTSPNTILSNYLVSNVAVGDINGDGKADLVLSAEEVEGSTVATGGILTITGNGDGTFNSPSLIAVGNFFWGMQLADMNTDGNPDIVATLYSTNGQPKNYYGMVTLLGLGNGQFSAPVNQLESLDGTLPQVGNFYNDNALDVMTESGYGPALFVGQGASTVTLAASAASEVFGSSETLTATVTAGMSNRPSPTGSVSFYDGSTLLGKTDAANGAATFTTASLSVGTHSVTAIYAGDANFNPATSSPAAVTISALAPASVSLAASASAAIFGSNETFTATVTAGTSNGSVPTGSVSFYDGSTLLGSAAVTNGSAAFTTASLAVGAHNVLAVYSGDSNFDTATSSSAAVTIRALASASVSLTASVSSAVFGSSETFTATVAAGTSNGVVPTGSVSFYDGSTLLGSVAVANGSAAFTTASLAVGGHSVVATYSGDTNFSPVTSLPAAVTISALTPAFSLTGAPATLSIGSGANGVVTLNIAANASFSGAVNLSCSGAPSKASCTVNPGSVTLAAGQSTTATVVIGTTTTSADVKRSTAPWGAAGAAASLAMLCGVFFGRRKRVRMLAGLSLAVIVSLGTLLTGCSGGGSTAPATGPTSFTVTITATPASGSTAPAQTTTVNVTVN